jgi:Family of unknown function (DUF5760)
MNPHTENSLAKNEWMEQVKRWMILDTQLKYINEKTKKIREEKSDLNEKICTFLENTQTKQISTNQGRIRMTEKKEYETLSFTFLETHLSKILHDPNQVQKVIQFLKEQRTVKTSNDLVFRIKNESG